MSHPAHAVPETVRLRAWRVLFETVGSGYLWSPDHIIGITLWRLHEVSSSLVVVSQYSSVR